MKNHLRDIVKKRFDKNLDQLPEREQRVIKHFNDVALPKEVKEASLTFSEQTSVNVEGEAAKSDFGTFIKPIRLTIGDRTFSFNR